MHIRDALNQALAIMRQRQWADALTVLHDILNVRVDDPVVLMLMGTCHRQLGHDGIAYALLKRAIELKPDNYEALFNLCAILREQGEHDEEVRLLKYCQELRPNEPDVLHNLAGAYLSNATPEIAEDYARRSLEIEGDRPDTWIQLSLALLEQERWGEGFDAWDRALVVGERKTRNFWALGQTPMWDGTPGKRVMVYGEQGHGDEIMFASCLPDLLAISEQVYIDTSKPDLVPLYERSFPEAVVFCTPDSQAKPYHFGLDIDAAIPFGSLPTVFRREEKDFPAHDGYIKAHPAKAAEMRRRLDALGEGLKIGIAWRGGIKKTRSVNRVIGLEHWAPILQQENAHFVSVQYTPDAGGEVMIQQDTTGVRIHHWQPVIDDFDMLTALISELDLLISVPQTAVHQRGALGKETWVLTHYKHPWPFGRTREDMVWYPKQVRQFRMGANDGGWDMAIMRCARALAERTGSEPGAVYIPSAKEIETFQLSNRPC